MKETSGPPSATPETSPPAPARRPRLSKKWRDRAALASGVLGVYAIIGFLVVPPIARSRIVKLAAEKLHRRVTIDRVRFNPFTFTAVLGGFDLRDRDGGDLLKFDRLTVDLQVSGLVRRAWKFRVIRIERPRLTARIAADGKLSVADLLAAPSPPPSPAPARTPRIIVGRFQMDSGRLDYVDESRTPRFAEALDPINLDVRAFSTIPDATGDHGLTFGIGPDTRIHWTGSQTIEPLHLEGRCEVTGLSLPLLWRYAAPAPGLELRDGRADLSWSYVVRKEAGGLGLSLADASLAARDIALRPATGGEDWLAVPLAEVKGIRAEWPARTVDIEGIKIAGPRVVAALEADGRTNWQAVLAGPTGTAEPDPAGAAGSTAPAPTAPVPGSAKPWAVKVGSFEIENGAGAFDDRTAVPPVAVVVSGLGLRLENLSTDLTAPVGLRLAARINEAGELSVSGPVTPDPLSADFTLGVSGLDLVPFRSYLQMFPGAEVRAGRAELKGRFHLAEGKPSLRFEGEGAIAGLDLAGAGTGQLLAWDLAKASGIVLTRQPDRLRAARLDLDRPFFRISISRDGTLNLSQIAGPPPAPAPAAPPAPAFPVDIAAIAINDATVDYTDESLILPFDTKIYSTNGTLRDLSTTSAAAARLDLEGRVAQAGFVKASGTLRISDPFTSTDIGVTFRRVPMTDLTPYIAQFAGYSVKTGDLDVDVRYRIQDRHLVGENKVVMTDLALGPKVEGAKGPGLPVRLAIALLKDKDGRINLDVPVEGTVDSPEFSYSKIFWQALKKILTSLVTAPFRAIGRLFGGGNDEDLDLVGFSSGSRELLETERETLTKIAAELAGRAEITVEVGGRFDPQTDADALRRSRLEARIDAKRTDAATLESILEALYTEAFSPERLEAERAKFQPQTAPSQPAKKKGRKKTPAPPPPPTSFNAGGFYDSLRAQLLAAEAVGEADLQALARDRAAAIAAALTAPGGLDPARVKAGDPKPVTRKKRGSDLVASEMTLSAGD